MMVLKLSAEKMSSPNSSKNETEASLFPRIFLTNLTALTKDSKLPAITEAEIDGNTLNLYLKSMVQVNGVFADADWMNFSFSGEKGKNPRLEFSLSDKNTYDFEFEKQEHFHETIDKIFCSSPKYSSNKTLEQVGLKTPKEIVASLYYKTPTAFWRGLPKEFLDKVSEFSFRGKFYNIRWPIDGRLSNKGNIRNANPKELSAWALDSVGFNQRDAEFLKLKDTLINTGFIKYQFNKGKGYGQEEHHFLIDSEKIDYKQMQILEEIAREEPNQLKARDFSSSSIEAEILIDGKFNRDVFGKVPKEFDSYLAYGKSEVVGGNIHIIYDRQYDSNNPMRVILKNSSLEDVERFVNFGAVSDSKVLIRPREKNGLYQKAVCLSK